MITLFKKKKEDKENIRAMISVSGRVQGVMFRETCQKKAIASGVSGWVKNLREGKVEAVFEGERKMVEKMVNWSKKGPIWAKVDSFEVLWEDYQNEFSDFEIRYDF